MAKLQKFITTLVGFSSGSIGGGVGDSVVVAVSGSDNSENNIVSYSVGNTGDSADSVDISSAEVVVAEVSACGMLIVVVVLGIVSSVDDDGVDGSVDSEGGGSSDGDVICVGISSDGDCSGNVVVVVLVMAI